MKVAHVITGLSTGGAEMMLYKLLSRTEHEAEVISLTDIGAIGERIQALGVPVRTLGMRRGASLNPAHVARLARWLREGAFDVVQTWMYHANLVGGLAAKLAGSIPLAWGIYHSTLDLGHSKRTTLWTNKLCARLSGTVPARVVYCAEVSRRVHEGLGYDAKKTVVIPIGFDLDAFEPDLLAKVSVCEELGIPGEAPLVGMIARLHPQKDHRNFVRAAALLHARLPEARFLLCGVTPEDEEVVGRIKEAGLQDRCHLLGWRGDLPRLNAAFGVATLSSYSGEGLPNVIGEAMACGTPCVVTDVGDSALVVGETGIVVPPRDPKALADGWCELMSLGDEKRRALGERARKRIQEHYSLDVVTGAYDALHTELAREKVAGTSR